MKLARLWQPRNPLFWVVVVLNALSTLLAWLVRTHPLPPALAVAVAVFAVGNAVLGLRLMWGLVKEPGTAQPPTPSQPPKLPTPPK